MLYLIYGEDREEARRKVNEILKPFLEKGGVNVFRMTSEDYTRAKLEELIVSHSLFSSGCVVVCDRLLENGEAEKDVLEKIKDIKNSPNLFVFSEKELNKKSLDLFKKLSDKIFCYENRAKVSLHADHEKFNIFSLCDALGERNKKKLWILFNEALEAGIEPEEIFWKFVWQIKNIFLTKKASTEELNKKLKVSPFVISKAEKYSGEWKEKELVSIHRQLLDLYHEVRRGAVEMESSLERIILG